MKERGIGVYPVWSVVRPRFAPTPAKAATPLARPSLARPQHRPPFSLHQVLAASRPPRAARCPLPFAPQPSWPGAAGRVGTAITPRAIAGSQSKALLHTLCAGRARHAMTAPAAASVGSAQWGRSAVARMRLVRDPGGCTAEAAVKGRVRPALWVGREALLLLGGGNREGCGGRGGFPRLVAHSLALVNQ